MRRRHCAVIAAVALAGTLVACGTDREPDDPDPQRAQLSLPAEDVTVLGDKDAGALALAVSRGLFDRAPVVVLAGRDDPASHGRAADTAVELGAPLLLAPDSGADGPPPANARAEEAVGASSAADQTGQAPGGTPTDHPSGTEAGEALADELARLGAEQVLPVGDAARAWAEDWERGTVLASDDQPDEAPAPELATVDSPEPLTGLAVLSSGAEHSVAGVATARAAGGRIHQLGRPDPRTDATAIQALAETPPTHTIAIGSEFGPAERLRNRLAVATAGVQLPGGGQVLFPDRRLVALYGHPGDGGLGALGEQSLDKAISRAQKVADEYQSLVDEPVIPTMEIITTVASSSPGPAGDYSARTPVEQLRPWVDAASEEGMYVVLDLQPGHTDFLTQAQEYEQLLTEPHVGLALDPEWRLASHEQHMVNIGSVNAAEVNQVADWLADLTAEHRLPQKLLIVHQFTLAMIDDRSELATRHDELSVMIHADGFGTPGQKLDTWRALRHGAPDVWWGWKNFYDEDQPTFTPAETVELDPSPRFISYQ